MKTSLQASAVDGAPTRVHVISNGKTIEVSQEHAGIRFRLSPTQARMVSAVLRESAREIDRTKGGAL